MDVMLRQLSDDHQAGRANVSAKAAIAYPSENHSPS